jgi:hypothetical protein
VDGERLGRLENICLINYLLGRMDGGEKQRRDCFSAVSDSPPCERAELALTRAFLSRALHVTTFHFLAMSTFPNYC